ncbi:MAG TPA: MATE family efflux transporter [Bacteroidetes bacterium]|nr:MATE family efflux transporter [Bacteroidota bacterium]
MNRKILNLAVPNIISNITVPLLGMVDLALVGHLDSAVYIGAIALGGTIFNFIYWGFSFLRMGTSGFTAQACGRRDLQEATLWLVRALGVGLAGAILVLLLQRPIGWLSFTLFGGSKEVEYWAARYFYIRIWAAPATITLYAFTGWFIGMQNARFPMIITLVVNLLNIGFNALLVLGAGMRSDGVALGTVLAQYSGLGTAIWLYMRYYRKSGRNIVILKVWDKDALKRFFLINKDILIRTLSLIFVFTFFTAKSASRGDIILAVNTLLLQFFMVFSYLIDGFAYAAEALTGKYKGGGNQPMLKKTVQYLFAWGFALSILFALSYLAGGEFLIRKLTSNREVIAVVQPYMFWTVVIPLITFPAFLWDGIYIGVTASAGMRNSMLISLVLVFLPGYYFLTPILGNQGLWLAMMLFMITRGVVQTILSKKVVFGK